MGGGSAKRRRWLGVIFLLAALVMLIAGETLFRDRFGPLGFLAYWLTCFAFTFLAMLVAFLDVLATRRQTRDEHRAFLEQTLREIARKQTAGEGQKPPQRGPSTGSTK